MIVRGIIGSLVGGAIGAAIWAAIAYFTGYEVGYVAVGVGFLAGLGMAVCAKDDTGTTTGIIAAVIALVAIATGKYVAVKASIDKEASKISSTMQVDDGVLRLFMGKQICDEELKSGKTLTWPAGVTSIDDVEEFDQLPEDIQKDVDTRWAAMTPDEQSQYRAQTKEYLQGAIGEFANNYTNEHFSEAFSFFDILWGFLAIGAAFKVGSGDGD